MAQLPTPERTASLLPTVSPSLTRQPTSTFHLTKTDTPSPTITATFDAGNIKIRTPAPSAQCPAEKPEMMPVFEYSSFTSESVAHFRQQVRDFLNAGGTRQAVVVAYRRHNSWVTHGSIIQEKDITGDGVLDLLLTDSNTMYALICQNGQYQGNILIGETYHFEQPVIVDIKDMNLDGVPEIIAVAGDSRIQIVTVHEWDGSEFQSLIQDVAGSFPQTCSDLLGSSWVYAQDMDGYGTLELVLKQGIPIWTEYATGLPWRKETRTCTWNGNAFVLTQIEIDTPPEYRFQAVQDGDRAARAGEYDQALSLYQQAISSSKLLGWSQDWKIYEQELTLASTPQPTPLPDPAEYTNLAAYARFRILLLHIVQGNVSDAETVYDTLQQEYPGGQTGHAYAEMAAAFWNEYQKEQNMGQACAKAIEYATGHPAETLSYLGDGEYAVADYGDQSLEYKPEDLCPFQ